MEQSYMRLFWITTEVWRMFHFLVDILVGESFTDARLDKSQKKCLAYTHASTV